MKLGLEVQENLPNVDLNQLIPEHYLEEMKSKFTDDRLDEDKFYDEYQERREKISEYLTVLDNN